MTELYLIDGSSYIYRAFYAIKGLSNSKGLPTNAIFGFTNMLIKILNEKRPQLLAIAFDPKGPTKRHETYEAYKAQRPGMPDSLSVQIPYIHRIVEAFNIPILIMEGYEADDVIGTVAKQGEKDGHEVIIVTGDKDMLQLITPRIKIYDPMKDKFYGETEVIDRFGVNPSQIVEIMALMGDSIDNIPGVTGVGEKTAKELISLFGTVENLLLHIEELKKPKLQSILKEQADNARLSRKLALIQTDLSIKIDYNNFKPFKPSYDKMVELFRELEFSSLLKLIVPSQIEERDKDYRVISEEVELINTLKKISDLKRLSIYIECNVSDPITSRITGIAISFKDKESWYIPLIDKIIPTRGTFTLQQVKDHLGPYIENPDIKKYSHDIKRQIILLKRSGMKPQGFTFDTMIASYLLNPGRTDHGMESIALEYLQEISNFRGSTKVDRQISKETLTLTTETTRKQDSGQGSGQALSPERRGNSEGRRNGAEAFSLTCQHADFVWRLVNILEEKLRETGVRDLFYHVEIPLPEVLADMEMKGVKVDTDILILLSKEMDRDMGSICHRIYAIAGEEFNINSPKQLAVILFEKLGLKPLKRTKTGYSTDEGVLTELALQHELPAEILAYRQLSKLKSTYVDSLLSLINPETGRIHTSFSQTVTATGRLSSSRPNLQNIPIRTEMGQRIRETFVAEEGCVLLSSDYSQVELRILAHMSGDELLIEAFKRGEDIHTRTTVEIFGLSPEEITPEMRRRAKAVNFGIVYGISPFGLSSDLGISQQEAKEYIDNYFSRHTGVKAFIEKTLNRAMEDGYVTTLLNRRRYLPELASNDNNVRQFGERIAINTPIQGSAADIIKLAMIRIQERLKAQGLRSRMILQVHDELLFEVPVEELDVMKGLVEKEMEGVIPLAVPLKVDTGVGRNWREAG